MAVGSGAGGLDRFVVMQGFFDSLGTSWTSPCSPIVDRRLSKILAYTAHGVIAPEALRPDACVAISLQGIDTP
jgi:hypothetical protein